MLVVDDEDSVRGTIRRLLELVGFEVMEADGGKSAIDLLSDGDVDVVLTDVSMPGMDGIGLLRAIRERDVDLPVVLLTGLPALDSAVQAVELGAFRYLMKPFNATALVETLTMAGKLCRVNRLRRHVGAAAEGGSQSSPREEAFQQALTDAMETVWFAYQPVWTARTGARAGYEALMRSRDSTFPDVAALLGAAERTGRVSELGQLVRERALESWQVEPDRGLLFINLHPAELEDPTLLASDSALAHVAEQVVLEITERHTLRNLKGLDRTFGVLRDMGYRLALDDLGAGYASLNSFAVLRPDFVKLDMVLVRDIDHDPVRRRLVESMIHVCADLGITTVAEGIETSAERDTVVELGVDLLQGFLLGRPRRLGSSHG